MSIIMDNPAWLLWQVGLLGKEAKRKICRQNVLWRSSLKISLYGEGLKQDWAEGQFGFQGKPLSKAFACSSQRSGAGRLYVCRNVDVLRYAFLWVRA